MSHPDERQCESSESEDDYYNGSDTDDSSNDDASEARIFRKIVSDYEHVGTVFQRGDQYYNGSDADDSSKKDPSETRKFRKTSPHYENVGPFFQCQLPGIDEVYGESNESELEETSPERSTTDTEHRQRDKSGGDTQFGGGKHGTIAEGGATLKKSSSDSALVRRNCEKASAFKSRKAQSVAYSLSELLKTSTLYVLLHNDSIEIEKNEEGLRWYHSEISSDTAETRLREAFTKSKLQRNKSEAAYLVRKTVGATDYVLSIFVADKVIDMIITEDRPGFFSLGDLHHVQGLENHIRQYTSTRRDMEACTQPVQFKTFAKGTLPPSTSRKTGHTNLFHRVICEGDESLSKRILKHELCPDIDAKDTRGSTALHLAVLSGHDKLVEIVLDAGAYVDMMDINGCTALHLACGNNRVNIVRLLLEVGQSNPDTQCSLRGLTPLHVAAGTGSIDCVKILLELKANPDIVSNKSETPRDLAEKSGKLDIVELFDELHPRSRRGIRGRRNASRQTLSVKTEPLYQWVTTEIIINRSRQLSEIEARQEVKKPKDVFSHVERILERCSSHIPINQDSIRMRKTVIRRIFSKSGSLHRSLWCEMPEVVTSGVLESMDMEERKLQEAMFEILSSEASYQRSLLVLDKVFMKAPELTGEGSICLISKSDYQSLFCNIIDIKKCSDVFLADLEAEWKKSFVLNGICDIISRHAQSNFRPYIRYCGNQSFQDRTLKTLRKQPQFEDLLVGLEKHRDCQSLSLTSFLLLPMQRITRLPLLVDAIMKRLQRGTPGFASASQALEHLSSLARECDEGARKMQNAEEMLQLRPTLKFNKTREFPLVSSSRCLVKKGQLRMMTVHTSTLKFAGGRKTTLLDALLFNDVLLLTRKEGDLYQVENWCLRCNLDAHDTRGMSWLAGSVRYMFILTLGSNHQGKKEELLMCVDSENEHSRWMSALSKAPSVSSPELQRSKDNQGDHPIMECVKRYGAKESDEITLELADVVAVHKKTDDGWYWGERIRDGQCGWFPAKHTEVILNEQVRQHHLRVRERLLGGDQTRSASEPAKSESPKAAEFPESTRLIASPATGTGTGFEPTTRRFPSLSCSDA